MLSTTTVIVAGMVMVRVSPAPFWVSSTPVSLRLLFAWNITLVRSSVYWPPESQPSAGPNVIGLALAQVSPAVSELNTLMILVAHPPPSQYATVVAPAGNPHAASARTGTRNLLFIIKSLLGIHVTRDRVLRPPKSLCRIRIFSL